MAAVTYDVEGKQDDVKREMLALGYQDYLTGLNGQTCQLPETTLNRDNRSTAEAIGDLQAVANKVGTRIERAVAFSTAGFSGLGYP